jgi:hypothetical protein
MRLKRSQVPPAYNVVSSNSGGRFQRCCQIFISTPNVEASSPQDFSSQSVHKDVRVCQRCLEAHSRGHLYKESFSPEALN